MRLSYHRSLQVLTKGYFNVTLDHISIAGQNSFCEDNCYAIVDSGTSLIGGPKSVVHDLNRQLGAVEADFGEYMVDCDQVPYLPDISITFGGKTFGLSPKEYILKLRNDKSQWVCLTAFMTLDLHNSGPNSLNWVIGDIFLSHYYVEYDLDHHRVGFAYKKAHV